MDLWSEKNMAKYSYNYRWNHKILDIRYFSIWYQTHYIPFLIASPIGWKISIRFFHLHFAVPPHWASSSHDVFSEKIQYATRKLDPLSLYSGLKIYVYRISYIYLQVWWQQHHLSHWLQANLCLICFAWAHLGPWNQNVVWRYKF